MINMHKNIFNRYYKRLALFGILKSISRGLIIGFITLIISSLLFWFLGLKMQWIIYIVFLGIVIISTILFYFAAYKPNTREIATRIDEIGLEERMITMTELEGDDSFIARLQREDAIKALNTVDAKLLKFVVSIPVIVLLSLTFVFSASAFTVDCLYENGFIKSGLELINSNEDKVKEIYTIRYEVKGDGTIYGLLEQNVSAGDSAKFVYASAYDNNVFSGWYNSDDEFLSGYAGRIEEDIHSDLVVYAVFTLVDEEIVDDTDNDEEDKSGDSSDKPSDSSQSGNSQTNNDQDGSGDGTGDGAGSSFEEKNQIIDNETYYGGNTYKNARDDAMNDLENNSDIEDDYKDIASGYFDSIKN